MDLMRQMGPTSSDITTVLVSCVVGVWTSILAMELRYPQRCVRVPQSDFHSKSFSLRIHVSYICTVRTLLRSHFFTGEFASLL